MFDLFLTHSLYFPFILFFAGLAAGFIGSMGGSGGLILVPIMIAAGMHPALALGTARLAAMPAWALAIKNYHHSDNVDWSRIIIFSFLAIIAGSIGTVLIIDLPKEKIYPIVGIILITMPFLSIAIKGLGTQNINKSKLSNNLGYLFYFLAMIYGGFFGAGTTIITMFVLMAFMGYRSLEAHGTEMAAWVVMSIVSSAIFIYYGQVNYVYALIICISMMIGSHFGSRLAIKQGDYFVKWLVNIFAMGIGLKLLFWP